jgi:hypothetical protein
MRTAPIIHSSDYAQQPDIHIRCSGAWTEPAWGSPAETATGIEGVYKADNGDWYTFDDRPGPDFKVTCPKCQEMVDRGEGYREPGS